MARVILVIRKIVDRRAYNRANIVDLIPALTYRTNHSSSPPSLLTLPSRSSACPFSYLTLAGSVFFLNTTGWRSEGNLTRKLHFPWRCLRLKPASFPSRHRAPSLRGPSGPAKDSCHEPTLKSALCNFRILQSKQGRLFDGIRAK